LQERILSGATAGSRRCPCDRLLAFLTRTDFLDAHTDLMLESETATTGARYRIGA